MNNIIDLQPVRINFEKSTNSILTISLILYKSTINYIIDDLLNNQLNNISNCQIFLIQLTDQLKIMSCFMDRIWVQYLKDFYNDEFNNFKQKKIYFPTHLPNKQSRNNDDILLLNIFKNENDKILQNFINIQNIYKKYYQNNKNLLKEIFNKSHNTDMFNIDILQKFKNEINIINQNESCIDKKLINSYLFINNINIKKIINEIFIELEYIINKINDKNKLYY